MTMNKKKLLNGTSADAIFLMIVKVISTAVSLVITRLLSQYLSVQDYGTYSQILLIISTVSSLTILGLMDGANFFYCSIKDEERRTAFVSTMFALECTVGSIAGGIVWAFKNAIASGFENSDIKGLILFAVILPLLQNLLWMLQILMISVGKAKWIAIRNLILAFARLTAVIIVVTIVKNVAVVLMTTLFIDIAQLIVFTITLNHNQCPIKIKSVDFRLTSEILKYCLPMAVFVALNSLNRDIDKYVIALLTDTETLALYANASKALPLDIITTSFCTVLQPKLTRMINLGERKKAAETYKTFLELAFVSTTMFCSGIIAAAPQVIRLLYSEKYLDGLGIFCVYILVDMLRFTNVSMILSAAGKTKKLMLMSIGALGANCILNLVLYQIVGIIGPAIATVTVTVTFGIVMLYFNAKELETSIAKFFDIPFMTKFIIEIGISVAVFTFLRTLLEKQELHYFAILFVVAGGCCAVIFVCCAKRLINVLKIINSTK